MLFGDPRPGYGDALLVVNLQNDFLAGGSLAVSDSDALIPLLNEYIEAFLALDLPIYAIRDWHPPDHCSFQTQGGPWPPHCIAGSYGADLAPGLRLPENAVVISKGTQSDEEAYSGFADTDLAERLRRENVRRLFIGGLASEYCVFHTVQDALAEGFTVLLLKDAIGAMNRKAGDGDRAFAEMRRQGAIPVTLSEVTR